MCSLEMDVFDMDVVKALCQALIVQLKKKKQKKQKNRVISADTHSPNFGTSLFLVDSF